MKGREERLGRPHTWEVMAGEGPGVDRLRSTACFLDSLRHPGVVELVDVEERADDVWVVRTRYVGPSVDHLVRLGRAFSLEEVAGMGAALATTIADLHALGWAHRALRPEHVLLDEDGRPVLCGLGSVGGPADAGMCAADVAELSSLLLALVPEGRRSRDGRAVAAAINGRSRRKGGAAHLAARLAAPGLGARLPAVGPDISGEAQAPGVAVSGAGAPGSVPGAPSPPPVRFSAWPRPVAPPVAPPVEPVPVNADNGGVYGDEGGAGPRRWRSGQRMAVLVVGGLAVTGALWAAAPSGVAGPTCPAADRGCRPVTLSAGVLDTPAGRFAVGADGDVVVLGRWDCGPLSLPALLRPSSGQVWVFDRWPTAAADVAARPVAHVAGASALRVAPAPGGCDSLVVARGAAAPVTVRPGGGP